MWIRLLNSYQDFANAVRQMVAFHDEDEELYRQAIPIAHKSLNDARILDPVGSTRVARMEAILQQAQAPRREDEMEALPLEADAIYTDFYRDKRLKFKRLMVR